MPGDRLMPPRKKEPSLEEALERHDEITLLLEGGEPELDEALGLYEEGVRRVRLAEGVRGAAETRIEQLRPDGALG